MNPNIKPIATTAPSPADRMLKTAGLTLESQCWLVATFRVIDGRVLMEVTPNGWPTAELDTCLQLFGRDVDRRKALARQAEERTAEREAERVAAKGRVIAMEAETKPDTEAADATPEP